MNYKQKKYFRLNYSNKFFFPVIPVIFICIIERGARHNYYIIFREKKVNVEI